MGFASEASCGAIAWPFRVFVFSWRSIEHTETKNALVAKIRRTDRRVTRRLEVSTVASDDPERTKREEVLAVWSQAELRY
jgi:hypothetical protein